MIDCAVLQECINEYRNRGIHFDEIRTLFASADLEQPKQWRSVPAIIAHLSNEKLTELLKKASLFLENQKKFNDKLIVVYKDLSTDQLEKIESALSNTLENDTSLEYSYSVDAIEEVSSEGSIDDKLLFFKFKKTRSVFLKEDIDFENLNEEAKAEFVEFDKLVGIKAKKIICYDSLVIDKKENILIIQLDLVGLLRSSDLDKNLDLFQIMINKVISEKNGNAYILDRKANVVNLYGCIKNFYDNSEGLITKLSFTTSKGVHHETLKGAATDIRTADYHLGGKAKEGVIHPYRVTKKFNLDSKNNPQAFLGVRYQYYAKAGSKFLATARIFDIYNYQSYLFIIKKLLENI